MDASKMDQEAIKFHQEGTMRGIEVTIVASQLADENEDPVVPLLGFAYALVGFAMAMDINKEDLVEIVEECFDNVENKQ